MNDFPLSRPRLVGSAVALSALVHLPALLTGRPVNVDEAYIAIMGRMQHAGGELFRTLVDRKPPIMLWGYAALVPRSWSLWPVHALLVVLVALHGLVIVAIARRLGASSSIATLAGALAVIGSALFGPPDAHASNFELWGLLPASVAVLVALRAAGPEQFGRFVARAGSAGVLVGVATNTKQPYLFTLAVVVAALPRGRRSTGTLAAGLGFAGVTVACALASDWSGYWRWVWFGNSDYVRVGMLATALIALRQTVLFVALQLPLVIVAVRARRGADARAVTVLVVWGLSAFVGVASGLRFFGHYYQQVVPPLALAAAFGVAAFRERAPMVARRVVGASLVWVVALWSLFAVPSLAGPQRAPGALVDGIRAVTTTGDRVLVWGRLPDASVAAQRLPAGRFVHHAYLTGLWASGDGDPDPASHEPFRSRWTAFLADLHHDPPALIVDATPIVDGWEDYTVASTPLADFVAECYRRTAPIDALPTWRRTAQPCP